MNHRTTTAFVLSLLFAGCQPTDCADDDQDCDGYADNIDCNDADPEINPGMADNCDDHIDRNCDGVDGYLEDSTVYYRDADGDGYGNPDNWFVSCCGTPTSYVVNDSDCDDRTPLINPEAVEICDEIDQNCDGEIDEDCPVDTGNDTGN